MAESVFDIGLEGDELHQKLGGGIPKSSIVLIEGPSGIGKSIVAQRMLYGVLKHDIKATYVSSEMTVTGFINQMESLRYEITSKFFNKDLKVVSLFHPLRKIELQGTILDKILGSRELLESDVIMFDTLSEIFIKDKMDHDKCFSVLSDLKKITASGKSILVCIDPAIMDKNLLELLRRSCEVYIFLEERELYGKKLNYMIVKRFTGAKLEVEKEIGFKVRAGIGIVLEIAA